MQTVTGWDTTIAQALDLVGVFAFAVSGALLAVRKRYDIVGLVALATVTGLGGGILRDLLLGDVPPPALSDTRYLAVPVAAGVATFFGHAVVARHLRVPVLAFDAAGLGLFCVTGALKAMDAGVPALAAVVLGVMTATGGGIIRDTLAGDHPVVFRADSVLYAVPATCGAAVTVVAVRAGASVPVASVVIALAVFAWRMVALRRGWHAPHPYGTSGATG